MKKTVTPLRSLCAALAALVLLLAHRPLLPKMALPTCITA